MSVLSRVMRLRPEDRAAHLRLACGSDRQLYRAITEVMEWEQRMGSFLEKPLMSLPDMVHPFVPGQVISQRFEIIREIGEGGMGVVYEAFDRKRKQRIAIKAAKTGFDRLLSPELEGALRVRHPNVCLVNEIHTSETDQSVVDFLSMELLEGETLSARLSGSGKLPMEEATEVAKQLCDGLIGAHGSGVIHRDLKADNVILCRTEDNNLRVVITDFGLSQSATTPGTLCGTPRYIAPELWLGNPASKASDIYALGVILHEMVAGFPPSGDSSVKPRLQSGDIPRFYSQLVEGCLSIDPDRRHRALSEAPHILRQPVRLRTRRQALTIALGSICAGAVGAWLERDEIDDTLHPLPQKRFVALLAWPPTLDSRIKPIMNGVIEAIEDELARAEASDRDLFVISSQGVNSDGYGITQFQAIRDSLGANLVLAASATRANGRLRLLLTVQNALTNVVLRRRHISCNESDITTLTMKAVKLAAGLLNVHAENAENRLIPATSSVVAFTAFQAAEELKNKPNDNGLEAAIDSYKRAIEADPRYATAYAKLAIAYSRFYALHSDAGALELAQANAERAITIDEMSADAHTALAYVFEAKGNQKNALDEIEHALKLDPSNPRTLLWKAQIYQRFNRWNEAEEAYRRLKRERPNYWLAHQELGVLLNAQGKYEEAMQAFSAAAVVAPGSALALNNLGALQLKLGHFTNAEDTFRKSLKIKPSDLAYCNLAETLRAQGNYVDAIQFGREAIKLNASDDQNWLSLADSYDSVRGQERKAREYYKKASLAVQRHLAMNPTDGAGWMRLALYQAKSQSKKDASLLIKRAEGYGSNNVDSQLVKARVLARLGRRQEALAILATCFRRGATVFEVRSIADFNALRKTQEYARIVNMNVARNNQKF